jgi:hypothetical protein
MSRFSPAAQNMVCLGDRSVCSPFTVTKAAESLKAFRSANAWQHVEKVAGNY